MARSMKAGMPASGSSVMAAEAAMAAPTMAPVTRRPWCPGPQLTAFFTSAPILASSAAVNSVSA